MRATSGGRGAWLTPTGWTVAGITLLGLLLRLPSFNDSIAADELSSYFVVHGFGIGSVIDLVESGQEATPPLYYMLAWLTKGIGDRAEGLRVVSLIAGVGAIPLTYLLGRRTIGSPAGLVGAALVAVSPYMIFYSTEGRGYMLALLFALASTLALLYALETGRTGWWAAYAVLSAGAAYSHYTAVFVLAAQLAWALLFRRESWRPLLLSNAGALVLYLPWVPAFLDDRHQPAAKLIDFLQPFTWQAMKTDVSHWAVGHAVAPLATNPGHLALWLMAAGVLVGSVALALRLVPEGWSAWRPSSELVLVFLLAAATPIGAAVYSEFFTSVYLPRNLIASWPAWALLLGALVTAGRGWLRLGAVALIVAGFAIGGVKTLDPDQQRPDYEAAARYIDEESAPGDPVVEVPQPSPGPQTALEAELAPEGEAVPRRNPVYALQTGTLEARLRSREPGGAGPLALLPPPDPERLAGRLARQARGGRIVVVDWGTAPLEQIRLSPIGDLAPFLNALPARYREVASRTFPGYSTYQITVHVLEDEGARPGTG